MWQISIKLQIVGPKFSKDHANKICQFTVNIMQIILCKCWFQDAASFLPTRGPRPKMLQIPSKIVQNTANDNAANVFFGFQKEANSKEKCPSLKKKICSRSWTPCSLDSPCPMAAESFGANWSLSFVTHRLICSLFLQIFIVSEKWFYIVCDVFSMGF